MVFKRARGRDPCHPMWGFGRHHRRRAAISVTRAVWVRVGAIVASVSDAAEARGRAEDNGIGPGDAVYGCFRRMLFGVAVQKHRDNKILA